MVHPFTSIVASKLSPLLCLLLCEIQFHKRTRAISVAIHLAFLSWQSLLIAVSLQLCTFLDSISGETCPCINTSPYSVAYDKPSSHLLFKEELSCSCYIPFSKNNSADLLSDVSGTSSNHSINFNGSTFELLPMILVLWQQYIHIWYAPASITHVQVLELNWILCRASETCARAAHTPCSIFLWEDMPNLTNRFW